MVICTSFLLYFTQGLSNYPYTYVYRPVYFVNAYFCAIHLTNWMLSITIVLLNFCVPLVHDYQLQIQPYCIIYVSYCIAQNFDGGKLTDTDSSNVWWKIFWQMVTVFHYTYTCEWCTVLKQFNGLNFDGLARKHQKRQNFPPSKFYAIR